MASNAEIVSIWWRHHDYSNKNPSALYQVDLEVRSLQCTCLYTILAQRIHVSDTAYAALSKIPGYHMRERGEIDIKVGTVIDVLKRNDIWDIG